MMMIIRLCCADEERVEYNYWSGNSSSNRSRNSDIIKGERADTIMFDCCSLMAVWCKGIQN